MNMTDGRPKKTLTETHIRYAARIARYNREAANFLRVSYAIWKKHASQVSSEKYPGESIYEELRRNNTRVIGLKRVKETRGAKKLISDSIELFRDFSQEPQHPILHSRFYNTTQRLLFILITERLKPAECSCCGYSSIRLEDQKHPYRLTFRDSNPLNRSLENIDLVCLNCYFLNFDSTFNPDKIDPETGIAYKREWEYGFYKNRLSKLKKREIQAAAQLQKSTN